MNLTVGELKKFLENISDDTEIVFRCEYSTTALICKKVEKMTFLPPGKGLYCDLVRDESILTDLGRKNAKRGIYLS